MILRAISNLNDSISYDFRKPLLASSPLHGLSPVLSAEKDHLLLQSIAQISVCVFACFH